MPKIDKLLIIYIMRSLILIFVIIKLGLFRNLQSITITENRTDIGSNSIILNNNAELSVQDKNGVINISNS